MSRLEDLVEIAYPGEPHCPIVLLLDTSGSMSIHGKIEEMKDGLRAFKEELGSDVLARKRVEIAVVTFGETVEVAHPFSLVDAFTPPEISAAGLTPMGEAILCAITLIKERKEQYRTAGIDSYRPWIFLVTDGEPTDMYGGDALWEEVTGAIRTGEENGEFFFFPVGAEPADMKILAAISPPGRDPVRLRENRFSDMFVWLSRSQAKVSTSVTGDQVILEDFFGPGGWGELPLF
ncbi:vWA domain-containing protein [Methanogenium organophilum]|uniref:VWA domain-containing protein n=1 Tax=Methanogenium organophilum TaxID=2199 RepID=A0A9X9S473_METOG|nr:VWA domain-containing protein [Methanogenium organophilum]WAI01679.1 VWA domain-containing protein [Methanogenium organophilum]